MAFVRKEVRKLGVPWNDTLLWYAKAVGILSRRPIADKTSWRYLAAMHGINPTLWKNIGYLSDAEVLPKDAEARRYWNQCQHQSWYFLPWHRAYLVSFEAIVRAAVVSLGGPQDWTLPYWNYSSGDAGARDLPPAFTQKTLPGGNEDNPLFVARRFGTTIPEDWVDLRGRLEDNDFVGINDGANIGVGGPQTSFSLFGQQEGLVEAQPHDLVHAAVGGRGGLMSNPQTAALDPIFWLHHANIDRLWEVWLARDVRNKSPTDKEWLDGPADRAFAVFGADGKDIPSTPRDVQNLTALGYSYDDVSDPLGGVERLMDRLRVFNVADLARAAPTGAHRTMATRSKVELVGASDGTVRLGAQPATSRVTLASGASARVASSLASARVLASEAKEPDRVFLNLENVRGQNGAAIFDVYINAPGAGAEAAHHVGAFSLFGIEQASDPNGLHGGKGLTKVLEVTAAVDAMHLADPTLPGAVDVRIVPQSDVRDEDQIIVGQVSLYRRGA